MSEREKPELLPCPFCGGPPEIAKHFKDPTWRLSHRCNAVGYISIDWTDGPERLAKAWNTRAVRT